VALGLEAALTQTHSGTTRARTHRPVADKGSQAATICARLKA
jgi:hypothetical protein